MQGVGGAFDLGADFLSALRTRCDEAGALLIFDEVQCGIGRSRPAVRGEPLRRDAGHDHDRQGARRRLSLRGAADDAEASPAALKLDGLGTTFGGGPMACAAIEAVIEAIETEGLLANVRRVGDYIRSTCIVGPVTGHQGAGFLLGLRTRSMPAKEVQKALLARRTSSPAPAAIRTSCGCCRPSSSRRHEVELLVAALKRVAADPGTSSS